MTDITAQQIVEQLIRIRSSISFFASMVSFLSGMLFIILIATRNK